MLPTLPQNIKKAVNSTETVFKSLVIPVVIPTVPIAEKASNRESVKGNPLVLQIINVPQRAKSKLIIVNCNNLRFITNLNVLLSNKSLQIQDIMKIV